MWYGTVVPYVEELGAGKEAIVVEI